jgi:hypothetical protein
MVQINTTNYLPSQVSEKDMRPGRFLLLATLVGGFSIDASLEAKATEYGLSTYALGQNAFGAGVTPPPGTYLTSATSFYNGKIGSTLEFGGVTLGAGAHLEFLATAINGLYVFNHQVLGGNLGVSATVPVGYVNIDATVTAGPLTAQRTTDGFGLGDIGSKIQLGWQFGALSHTLYVQGVAPTGRYAAGFSPNIGLNRPGIDTGWAVTWVDKAHQLQFNGTVGVTFNFENTETNYKSGDEFHFEWAVGRELSPGFLVGLVGYDYRQITGDSGGPPVLGPFKGQVDAIGVGMSGTTLIGGKIPLIINMRTYREFNADHHWEGNSTTASATIRF